MIKLKFKTITPLSISNGEEIGLNIDYILQNNFLIKFNKTILSEYLAENNRFNLNQIYSQKEIQKLISKYSQELPEGLNLYSVSCDQKFLEDTSTYRSVKEFVNSNGHFYIPGSSIKGALLTSMNVASIGIDKFDPKIEDKFVIHDSTFINNEDMIVYRTEKRLPCQYNTVNNIMCLKENKFFEIIIAKSNNFDIKMIKDSLNNYSKQRTEKLLNSLKGWVSKENSFDGANIYEDAINIIKKEFNKLKENEFIINIGLGGGGWFKTVLESVPKDKFSSPPKNTVHTSTIINIDGEYRHIGWCKFTIEEI